MPNRKKGSQEKRNDSSKKGSGIMNEERHRDTSNKGGRASHDSGYGHETNSWEGKESSRRTGQEDSGNHSGNMSRM